MGFFYVLEIAVDLSWSFQWNSDCALVFPIFNITNRFIINIMDGIPENDII